MEPFDVDSSTYINFGVESNNKDSESKVANHVRMLK